MNHMMHGTPNDPDEEEEHTPAPPRRPAAVTSTPASSSTNPMHVEGLASHATPAFLQDRDSGLARRPMSFIEKNQHRIADKFQAEGEHPLYPGKVFNGQKWVRK